MSTSTGSSALAQAVANGRALPLTVLPGPHGPDRMIGSIGVGFRLGGEETGGQVAVVEHPFPPGALVPPHVHTREDEFSIVTAGAIGFRSGDDEVVLEAGGYISKPRGELHSMWRAGTAPARMIEIISPAGFENYFVELAEAVVAAGGRPDPSVIGPVAERFGLSFDLAEVPDLVARHGLTPPR